MSHAVRRITRLTCHMQSVDSFSPGQIACLLQVTEEIIVAGDRLRKIARHGIEKDD